MVRPGYRPERDPGAAGSKAGRSKYSLPDQVQKPHRVRTAHGLARRSRRRRLMIPPMFWDSHVLKDELVADIDNVNDRLAEAREDDMESALIAVEQFVFWTAFVIRKLADSYQLSDEFERTSWQVETFAKRPSAPPVDPLNWHRLDRHYSVETANPGRIGLRPLCGLLIHSFVFMPEMDDSGRALDALLFNSDRSKDTLLYRVTWDEFCSIVRQLYDDDVVEVSFNRQTGVMVKKGPTTAGGPSDL